MNNTIREQKAQKKEKAAMVKAIQDMAQSFGMDSIEFADPDGTVRDRIDVPSPPDTPCDVPQYGGGTVNIKKGDRIRFWYRGDYTSSWNQEAIGVVLCILPDRYEGNFRLAFNRENKSANEGASSCCLKSPSFAGWARVVEKL